MPGTADVLVGTANEKTNGKSGTSPRCPLIHLPTRTLAIPAGAQSKWHLAGQLFYLLRRPLRLFLQSRNFQFKFLPLRRRDPFDHRLVLLHFPESVHLRTLRGAHAPRVFHAASELNHLRVPPSNRLEKLGGNLRDFYSIRINQQWRIIFVWKDNHAHQVQITDYH